MTEKDKRTKTEKLTDVINNYLKLRTAIGAIALGILTVILNAVRGFSTTENFPAPIHYNLIFLTFLGIIFVITFVILYYKELDLENRDDFIKTEIAIRNPVKIGDMIKHELLKLHAELTALSHQEIVDGTALMFKAEYNKEREKLEEKAKTKNVQQLEADELRKKLDDLDKNGI